MAGEGSAKFGIGEISCPIDVGGNCVSYTHGEYAGSTAELLDEDGNVVQIEQYGKGSIEEHEATFELSCGNGFSSGIQLGGSNGVESVSISTSNSGWPQVTVKWYTGLPSCNDGMTFDVSCSVLGKRKAQALGLSATGHVQSSSWTASCSLELVLDGSGEPTGFAFGGGRIEASCETIGGTVSQGDMEIFSTSDSEGRGAFASVSGSGSKSLTGTKAAA